MGERKISNTNFILKRADGHTLSFGENSIFGIENINGLGIGNLKKDVAERAGEDGSVFLGMRVIDRVLEITARWDTAHKRAAFVNFFTPRKGMDFELTFNGSKFYGYCFLDDKYDAEKHGGNLYQDSQIDFALWFPDPYLYTETQYSYEIGYSLTPMFMYPIGPHEINPGQYIFSVINEAQVFTINNQNPTENGIQVIITASGQVVNPKIVNITTGEYTEFELTLEEGDVLYFNTESGFVSANLNGEDVLFNLTIGSEMISLISGENKIQFIPAAGANKSSVRVSFRGRVAAV